MTLWEAILYNPIIWIIYFYVIAFFCAWCSNTFRFEGSWKNLDKSIHWKEKK